MDRGAWRATVMGSQRLRHDLVTKQQQNTRGADDLGTGDICPAHLPDTRQLSRATPARSFA